MIGELDTKNQSNKTYILKIISTLGVNLRQVEKEAININNQIQKDKNDKIEKNDLIDKSMNDVENPDEATEDNILDATKMVSEEKGHVADTTSKPASSHEPTATTLFT